jgi:hypothetical protein
VSTTRPPKISGFFREERRAARSARRRPAFFELYQEDDMNRFGALGACLIASLAGCGDDEPTLKVTEEPAGENCPTGGFRVETDDQVFYSCDERAATEEVAAGAEGNPCFGDALRVTVTLEDGTTRDAYVCQPLVTDPASANVLLSQLKIAATTQRIECLCTDDPDEQASCEAQLELVDPLLRLASGCVGEVVAVVGPLPEGDRQAVECVLEHFDEAVACYDAIDGDECSPEVEAAREACDEMAEDAPATCGTPSPAFMQWAQSAQSVGQFLGCPFLGGA